MDSPISIPLVIADIFKRAEKIEFKADDNVCAKLAHHYDLNEVRSFSFSGKSEPVSKVRVRVRGFVESVFVQSCVVSLDPVESSIKEELDLFFTNRDTRRDRNSLEIDIDMEVNDPPEYVEGVVLDIGEFVLEHFALAIPAYPRKPDVEFFERLEDTEDSNSDQKDTPFAVLKSIKSE